MERRQGWLFPLMVVAAGTVTVFGGLGIAAILGYLPPPRAVEGAGSSHVVLTPAYYEALERSGARLLAQVDVAGSETPKGAGSAARRTPEGHR